MIDEFCYLGEMMTCGLEAEDTVRARTTTAWKKWRELASLLVNNKIPLKSRVKIYNACIRPVLLYGSETWALTKQIETKLRSSDCRMLRYMAHIKWQDTKTNDEVIKICEIEDITSRLRRGRLRWFGHVRRREEAHILRRAMDLELAGKRLVGRPKKSWYNCVKEDLKTLGITEENTQNREVWRKLISVKV